MSTYNNTLIGEKNQKVGDWTYSYIRDIILLLQYNRYDLNLNKFGGCHH